MFWRSEKSVIVSCNIVTKTGFCMYVLNNYTGNITIYSNNDWHYVGQMYLSPGICAIEICVILFQTSTLRMMIVFYLNYRFYNSKFDSFAWQNDVLPQLNQPDHLYLKKGYSSSNANVLILAFLIIISSIIHIITQIRRM